MMIMNFANHKQGIRLHIVYTKRYKRINAYVMQRTVSVMNNNTIIEKHIQHIVL